MTVSDEELIADLKEVFRKNYHFGGLSAPQTDGLLFIANKGKDYWNAWRRRYPSTQIVLSGLNEHALRGIDFSGFIFPTIEGMPCVDFRGTHFLKENKFEDVDFGNNAIFEGARFESVSFQNSKFGNDADFESTQCDSDANFSGSTFGSGANFELANIIGFANFSGSNFGKNVNFERTNFSSSADFTASSFGIDTRFTGTKFRDTAVFRSCTFSGTLIFSPAEINRFIDFGSIHSKRGTLFGGNTNFQDLQSRGDAIFSDCIFCEKTTFSSARFNGHTYFHRTTFRGHVEFIGGSFEKVEFFETTFDDSAKFRGTAFNAETTFLSTIFLGKVHFNESNSSNQSPAFSEIRFLGCWFAKDAIFRNRDFKTTALFGKAPTGRGRNLREVAHRISIDIKRHHADKTVFIGIPDFHGCNFHQDTSFVGTEFEVPPSNDAARAFRTLKLAMEKLKSTHEEQKFFRLEMEADRPTLPGLRPWISKIYQLTSDYGFSLWRPIACLILISVMFGIAYGLLANTCAADSECAKIAWAANTGSSADRTSAVIKYTLASFSPAPGLDKMQTELRAPLFGHHGWVPITALVLEILHKIIALVMVFLFALALRNLFKMKS